ncbi:MAG: hypothetical protein IJ511_04965 [Bacteroides sp.]|nr:hypothetical protein [Bacteroides sp.]
MRKKHLWVVALGALMSCTSAAQRDRSETANRQTMMQAWVDSVYDRMTVEERTAQLVGIRPEQVMTDGRLSLEGVCRLTGREIAMPRREVLFSIAGWRKRPLQTIA